MRPLLLSSLASLSLLLVAGPAAAKPAEVAHPFLLWTASDLASMRQQWKSDPAYQARFGAFLDHPHGKPVSGLLRYAVLGDAAAGEAEKAEFLRVIRSEQPLGGAQWVTVLRYDLLQALLSDAEREETGKVFREYIRQTFELGGVFNADLFDNSANYARYDAREYTRSNWLPNIIGPRKISANLMALALRDEALIRTTWAAYGSWKWYFDHYLADVGFYSEEFSKMGALPGEMIVFSIGAENLGLDELGFGYRGKDGATMRGHLQSPILVGYPRIDLHSERPQYPMLTMGDLRMAGSSVVKPLPTAALQHAIVVGFLPNGEGGNVLWRAHGAWGGTVRGRKMAQWDGYSNFTPKMQIPLWFELGHKRWPELGFGYFLAAMRTPGEAAWPSTPLFGIPPVKPGDVAAPPAPSALYPQRGMAMLRVDESPAYWESPAPAAGLRLATKYAHSVNDSFALAGFVAFNRHIYLNRQVTPGYASGWSRSIQSHCGVFIGAQEPKFDDEAAHWSAFRPDLKTVAMRSSAIYPGSTVERVYALHRDYLLEVTRVRQETGEPQPVRWMVHALGLADRAPFRAAAAWPEGLHALANPASADGAVATTFTQTCALDDPKAAVLPAAWFDRRIGVRIRFAGPEGSKTWVGTTPLPVRSVTGADGKKTEESVPSEVGGETLMLDVPGAADVTVAVLHEPFEKGAPRIEGFRAVARDADSITVEIGGKGQPVHHRVRVPLGAADGSGLKLEAL
jgi:hypothetical protein